MTKVKKITTVCCMAAIGITLSSCGLVSPFEAAKLPLAQVHDEKPDVKQQSKPPSPPKSLNNNELFPGTNKYVPDAASQHRKTKGSGEGSYSLNFDEADLGEVAKVVLSEILGQNYVLSPKVTGKVTLQTSDPLTKDELIPTLEMVLRMNNAVLIKDSSIYHIEPANDALNSSSFSLPSTDGKTGYQVRVIPIKNIAVQDIVDVIKPLVQEKTILTVDGNRNILVVSGTPDELARVMDMVSAFDVDILKGRSFGLFPLVHVDAETIIKELDEVFNKKNKDKGDAEGSGGGGVSVSGSGSSFFRFMPIERLNAVMAITRQAEYLKDIESWIYRLDRANTASGGGVNVYKVQHADAAELANTLNGIFTNAQSLSRPGQVAPGSTAVQAGNQSTTGTGMSTPLAGSTGNTSGLSGASGTSGTSGGSSGGSSSSGSLKRASATVPTGKAKVAGVGDVRIISDKSNNSLIIVATPREYEVILPVIKQLDVLPFQVLIDATIVAVTLKDDLKYGIQWFLQHGNSSVGSDSSTAATLGSMAVANVAAFATGGLTAIYNSGAINGLLSAQADKGNVKVISSPSLMVLNNQEAKINVGDQVPIQTGTTSMPVGGSTGLAVANSIQYMDTGVTLNVTPRVNANSMVIMNVHQIVSNPEITTTGVSTSPTIAKKEITSSIAVYDGETIVLGGLISDDNEVNKSGIPWLYDVPYAGALFGTTAYTRNKTELVVLITPRVVKSKVESRQISDEFKRKLTGIYGM